MNQNSDNGKKTRPPATIVGTHNIRDGRNSGLVAAIRAIELGNYDFVVTTETKIVDEVYCKNRLGYDCMCSEAVSAANGGAKWGIGLICRENPQGWSLESLRFHGPNVLSFYCRSGTQKIPIIGAHLPPSALEHIHDLETAFDRFPNESPIALGDTNADIHDLTSERSQQLAAPFATNGLFDMLPHFRQRKSFRHNTTWFQRREADRVIIRSRCDYILGSDRRLFETVSIRDPRNYSSDHHAIKARLLRRPTRCHLRHPRGRRTSPLKLPVGPLNKIDSPFQDVKKCADIPPPNAPQPRPQWMSEETLRLLDTRASCRRRHNYDGNQVRSLTRQINRSLRQDRTRRAETAAEEIGSCLNVQENEYPDFVGAYGMLKRWCRHAGSRRLKPAREDLIKVSNDFQALHSREHPSPPGNPIPPQVGPFDINDAVPTEEEIIDAVKRLRNGKSPGHSKVRCEDFKEWHSEAFPEREELTPIRHRWDKLVEIIHHIWTNGALPQESCWTVLVVLPKGKTDTRGIGLNEVLQKVVESIIDQRVKTAAQFHDALHAFRARRGTGAAIIELKLVQELASTQQTPLHLVYLDLRKACDTVDRTRALDTLAGYGAGPNMMRILRYFWDNQQIVARQSGFHGPIFTATRGTTQGGLFSPTLFNVLVDNVIRHWLSTSVDDDGSVAQDGFGIRVADKLSLFYADDGAVGSRDDNWLQPSLNVLVSTFRRIGLASNVLKTKTQTCYPGSIRSTLSREACDRRNTGEGDTHRQRLRRRVTCPECNKDLAAGSMAHHRRSQHGIEPEINWNALNVAQADVDPITCVVSFPGMLHEIQCPVEDCSHRARSRGGLRSHFQRRHWRHSIHIQEEHPLPHPKCQRCDLQVPFGRLNNSHFNSDLCRNGAARKRQREAVLLSHRASAMYFDIGGAPPPVDRVRTFKHLGRLTADNNSDWPALHSNLKKAQARWAMVAKVLEKDGASMRCRGLFYKAVVQSALLHGCETWTISDSMMKALEGFHHRVARRITGDQARRLPNGEWVCPPLAPAMEQAGLYSMKECVRRRQARMIEYVATRPIMGLCEEARTLSGSSRFLRWWQQDHSEAVDGEAADNDDGANENGQNDEDDDDVN